jgi:hypothetical protein
MIMRVGPRVSGARLEPFAFVVPAYFGLGFGGELSE